MSAANPFTESDAQVLRAAGIAPGDAERQLRLLREGMRPPVLLRPCTVGDGIAVPDPAEFESLGAAYRKACAEGRWVFFIPASGAATRMADSLLGLASLEETLKRQGKSPSVLRDRFGNPDKWRNLPKALMPFHRDGENFRTPIEEHIREAAALSSDAPGATARLHFTISPEHEIPFLKEVDRVLGRLRATGTLAEVTHSFQDPATQTLALDESGDPFRDAGGSLLLRPGGHGSLLRNLESRGGEFAWIRNIDNIPVEPIRAAGRPLRRALGGMLMRAAAESAARPARVCGMVANTGEPGGGPFWVQGKHDPEVRIVESAEVDASSPGQGAIFRAATHFNPVDMACALRDGSGRPFRLEEFSDPSACFIAEKSREGRSLLALEWPGLWNGAMAGWDTRCVELPLSQFAPVKTAADLLRKEHLG